MRVQKGLRFTYILHKRLVKPGELIKLPCPGCHHVLLQVNSDTVVCTNDFGLPPSELAASDSFQIIRHACGTKISVWWN